MQIWRGAWVGRIAPLAWTLALIDRHALFQKEGGVTFIIQHGAHFVGKGCRGIRFGKKCDARLKHAMLSNGVIRVT